MACFTQVFVRSTRKISLNFLSAIFSDSYNVAQENKDLSEEKHVVLYDVFSKYELFFEVTLGTFKTKPVDTGLLPYAKSYHSNMYPVSWSHKAIFKK